MIQNKTKLPPLLITDEFEHFEIYHSAAQTEGNPYLEKFSIKNIQFKIPDLDHDMAWFIGLYISSQRLYQNDNKNITIIIDYNKDIVEKIKAQIKRFWDFDIIIYVRKNNLVCIYTTDAACLASYFNKHITINSSLRDDEKLPDFIIQAENDIKLSFIKGIFDGYIKNQTPEINPALTLQIQNICSSIGINTQIIENRIIEI